MTRLSHDDSQRQHLAAKGTGGPASDPQSQDADRIAMKRTVQLQIQQLAQRAMMTSNWAARLLGGLDGPPGMREQASLDFFGAAAQVLQTNTPPRQERSLKEPASEVLDICSWNFRSCYQRVRRRRQGTPPPVRIEAKNNGKGIGIPYAEPGWLSGLR